MRRVLMTVILTNGVVNNLFDQCFRHSFILFSFYHKFLLSFIVPFV